VKGLIGSNNTYAIGEKNDGVELNIQWSKLFFDLVLSKNKEIKIPQKHIFYIVIPLPCEYLVHERTSYLY